MGHGRRRLLLVLLTAALVALAGAAASDADAPRPEVVAVPLPALDVAAIAVKQEARRRAAAERRRAELRRLGRSRSVRAALRRAWMAGALTRAEHDRLRRVLRDARAAAGRLPRARAAELGAVVRATEALGRRRMLTTTRIRPVFLVLERNTWFWRHRPFPAPGARTTFGSDPVVFGYFPGRGVQFHPLASFGKANALTKECRETKHCRRRDLRRVLDRLLELSTTRSGYRAWEYQFGFGGGRPPWVSGIAQGTAVQVLARGARILDDRRYLKPARGALGAFEQRPPAGVALRGGRGRHFLMYSFDRRLQILNGHVQAVNGLHDLAALSGSARARRLERRGESWLRARLGGFDTGAWSLYSRGGAEANLNYHDLQRDFLRGLCRRTGRRAYCTTSRRFRRYLHEPPRISIAAARGLRLGRPTAVAFRLSKVATVRVDVWGTRGLVARRLVHLPRGRHTVGWTPPARGRYRVRVAATGPSGPQGVAKDTVRVVLPRPQRRSREAPGRAERREKGVARRSRDRARDGARAPRGPRGS